MTKLQRIGISVAALALVIDFYSAGFLHGKRSGINAAPSTQAQAQVEPSPTPEVYVLTEGAID
jgi:hypothetical protein